MKKTLVILALMAFNFSLLSQSYQVKKLTNKDGLFNNNIQKLYIDSKGILWIKTVEGICYYDGIAFKKIYIENPLNGRGQFMEANNAIHYADAMYPIVITDYKAYLEKFDSTYIYELNKEIGAVQAGQHWIDHSGWHMFTLKLNDTIVLFNQSKTIKIATKPYSSKYGFPNVHLDNLNNIWISFTSEIDKLITLFKFNNGKLEQHKTQFTSHGILGLQYIYSRNNQLVLTFENCISIEKKDGSNHTIDYPFPNIMNLYSNNIVEDDNGALWMPFQKGLYKIENMKLTVYPDSNRQIYCGGKRVLAYDSKGNYIVDNNACTDYNYANSIVKSDGFIITGNKIFKNGKFYTITELPEGVFIIDIIIDNLSQIWLATSDGLYKCSPRSFMTETEPEITTPNCSLLSQQMCYPDKGHISFTFETVWSNQKKETFQVNKKLKSIDPMNFDGEYVYSKIINGTNFLFFEDTFFVVREGKIINPTYISSPNIKPLNVSISYWYDLQAHRAASFSTKNEFLFLWKNYYIKTDGQNFSKLGAESGLNKPIKNFYTVNQIGNSVNTELPTIFTDAGVYAYENGFRFVTNDFFEKQTYLSNFKINYNNNSYLISQSYNKSVKAYKLIKNIYKPIQINNPANFNLNKISGIICNQNNDFLLYSFSGDIGKITFTEESIKIDKFKTSDEFKHLFSETADKIFHGNNLYLKTQNAGSLLICNLNLNELIVSNYKIIDFETQNLRIKQESNYLIIKYNNGTPISKYIDLNKPVFNEKENAIHFNTMYYMMKNDTITISDIKNPGLPYNFSYLDIRFKAVCLAEGRPVRYRYRLGSNSTWSETSEEKVSFVNLEPGNYTFQLISSNNDGLWNKTPIEFSFTVLPPWYRTWWAYTSYVLIGFGSVFGFIKNRTKKLKKEKQKLEKIVEERTAEVVEQKHLIEEKNKEITDSIHYAQKIQHTLLASTNLLNENLKDYFVFFKPKDIVSGDFYWAAKHENGFLIITADCTGHGVPGAFMSLLSISYLNEITKEQKITQPDKVFNLLRDKIITNFDSDNSEHERKDGMDAVICNYNFNSNQLQFAAANNPLWLIRNGELLEHKPDKMPVGRAAVENKPFSLQELHLQKGDIVYTLTDGYADQFGGPKGKKFMYKQMKELICSISHLPMKEQKEKLESEINAWKGHTEQVDDILIIGVRI